MRVGKLESALIIPFKRTVIGFPSEEEVTAIPSKPLASPVAAAATEMSTNSHLESSLSSVTKSPKAIVAPPVPVTVIPEYLPSAEPAGSRAMEVFSPSVMLPVSVPPSVVKIVLPSIAATPAETLVNVVSEAWPNSKPVFMTGEVIV